MIISVNRHKVKSAVKKEPFKERPNKNGLRHLLISLLRRQTSLSLGLWRREGDLNPRAGTTDLLVFEARPFSHLGTSPQRCLLYHSCDTEFNHNLLSFLYQSVLYRYFDGAYFAKMTSFTDDGYRPQIDAAGEIHQPAANIPYYSLTISFACPINYLSRLTRLSLRALVQTQNDDRLIAAAAIIGLSVHPPNSGVYNPAASGMRRTL